MENYLKHHHIELQDSKDPIKGRYVNATSAIAKGSVIVTSEPLGTVPIPQTINEYCNYCFRKQSSPPLQRCSQCKKAYFCDTACFKNAWLSYHHCVCKANTNPTSTNVFAEDAMDLEMLEKVALNVSRYRKHVPAQSASSPCEVQIESVDVTMEAFFSLMGHDQIRQKHVMVKFNSLAEEALKKPFIMQTGLSKEELVHYLNVFKSNNFSIDDPEMFAIGEGTYPIAALFNHSCRPNAVIMFDGNMASVHAIEDIEKDQEITIAYVDAAHSRTYRRRTLSEKYFFNCTCLRCQYNNENGKGYLSKIDELLGEEESEWDRAQQLLQNNGSDERNRILKKVDEWDLLELCRQFDRKSDGIPDPQKPLTIATYTHYFIQFFAPYLLTWNQPNLHQQQAGPNTEACLIDFDDPLPSLAKPAVQETYDAILSTAIETMLSYPINTSDSVPYRLTTLSACTRLFYDEMSEGHWQRAVKLGMYILIEYCLIYPPYHPMLAQHFLLLAKSCWNSIVQNELINDGKRLEKVYERGVRRWIMSSKETVAIAFGKGSALWRDTLELEWLFLREQKLK